MLSFVVFSTSAQNYNYTPSSTSYLSCPDDLVKWTGGVVTMKLKSISNHKATFTIKVCNGNAFGGKGYFMVGNLGDYYIGGYAFSLDDFSPVGTSISYVTVSAGSYTKDITIDLDDYKSGDHFYGGFYSNLAGITYYCGNIDIDWTELSTLSLTSSSWNTASTRSTKTVNVTSNTSWTVSETKLG